LQIKKETSPGTHFRALRSQGDKGTKETGKDFQGWGQPRECKYRKPSVKHVSRRQGLIVLNAADMSGKVRVEI
jgi:hypothetical protein